MLTPKHQAGLSVDELIALGGGFGTTQRSILAGAVAGYFVDATAIFLPIFLMPRLYETVWSTLSAEDQRLTDALASSLFMLGNTLGLILGGVFGDYCGRRLPLLVGVALTTLATAASLALEPTVTGFLTSRVVAGFGAGGALNSGFLLAVEWAPPSHRLFCKTCTSSMGWVPGILFLCAVARVTREVACPWQALLWCLSPAPFVWLFMYRRLHESPRFALMSGAPQAALRLLHRSATANGKPLPFDAAIALPGGGALGCVGDDDGDMECDATMRLPPPTRPSGGSAAADPSAAAAPPSGRCAGSCGPGSLFHRSVRRRTLLVGGAWFGSTGVYYGVILAPLRLAHLSLEARTAVGALVELPVFLAMGPLGEAYGRRRTWAGFLLTAGVSLLVLGLLTSGGPTASAAAGSSVLGHGGGGSGASQHAHRGHAVVPGVHHTGHPHYHQLAHHHHHHHYHVYTHAAPSTLATTEHANGTDWRTAPAAAADGGVAASPAAERADAGGAAATSWTLRSSLILAFVLLARGGGAGCACLCYVAAAEQFPTGCRNSAIGFGGACGRFASVLAPMVVHLLEAPFYALAAVAACAALAALALPETAGKPITERTDEREHD